MNLHGQGAGWEFGIACHTLTDIDSGFNLICPVKPLPSFVCLDPDVVARDFDLHRIAHNEIARHVTAGDGYIGEIVYLNYETKSRSAALQF